MLGRSRFAAIVLACSLPLAAPGLAVAQDGGDVTKGQRLLAEGDGLADEGKYDEAVLKYVDAFEALLPQMRKLPFKREVKPHFTPRKDMKGLVEQMFKDEVTPEDLHADEAGMKALGMVPRDLDLKATMIRLMSEEVAGFYDSKKETMHLIHEELAPPRPKGKDPGLFERLFGAGDAEAFDKEENKAVLAHELTHALADQHFELDKMQELTEGDSDRQLALSALIEGEAMLTMAGAAANDWAGTATPDIPARQLALQMNLLGSMAGFLGGPAMREVPPVLRETLIFPYAKGMVFVAHQTNAGGWPSLDWSYANPPLSTEQILHPEKYGGGPDADPPTALDLGELKPGGDWKELDRDVVGELVTGVMLANHNGRAAAAGWDGDTAVIFEAPGEKLGLVWLSTWDSEAEAREFAKSYAAFQPTKFIPPPAGQPDGEADDAGAADARGEPVEPAAPAAEATNFPAEDGDAVLRRPLPGIDDGRVIHVEVRGTDVLVIEGFDANATDALAKSASAAKKSEKTNAAKAAGADDPQPAP